MRSWYVVDVVQVVQLLQHEVARVVEQAGALVVADTVEEHLVAHAVVQVFAGVDLVADVHPRGVEGVEDRPPAPRQLVERFFDQAGRARRPGIEVRPGECARERGVGGEAEVLRGLRGVEHLLHRPLLPCLGVAANLGRGEAVEAGVVGRVHCDELALQVGREFGDLEAVLRERALDLVAVGLALGGVLQVEQAAVPARDLHALVAQAAGPTADGVERVERCRVAGELGQEDGRALDRLHVSLLWTARPSAGRAGRHDAADAGLRQRVESLVDSRWPPA